MLALPAMDTGRFMLCQSCHASAVSFRLFAFSLSRLWSAIAWMKLKQLASSSNATCRLSTSSDANFHRQIFLPDTVVQTFIALVFVFGGYALEGFIFLLIAAWVIYRWRAGLRVHAKVRHKVVSAFLPVPYLRVERTKRCTRALSFIWLF